MADQTRRILDVDVREVSLVDRAANLRQFLVLKRLTEEDMGAFIDERSEVVKAKKDDEVKEDEVKEDEAKEEAEKEAAKKAGKPKLKEDEEKEEVEEADKAAKKKAGKPKKKEEGDEEEEDAEVECQEKKKAMNPMAVAGMLQGLKGKGLPSEAVKEVVAWLESQKKSGKPDPSEEAPPDEEVEASEKKKRGMKKNLAVAIMEDGSIIVEGEEISKARKFTESRTGTVKEVVTQLLNLLHDVDSDAAKAVVSSFSQLPLGSVPASEVKPLGTEGKVSKQLEEENAELKKRLETLEKSRSDSKELPGDKTDGAQVKKSLWNGVL